MSCRHLSKANDKGAIKGKKGGLKIVRKNGKSSQTCLTNWNDMIACGMPEAQVENAFQRHFGSKPDQVHLNDDFCKKYGWLSYNLLGSATYYNVAIQPKVDISGERFLDNTTDKPYDTTVTLSTTVSDSATCKVSSSSSVSVGSSISIGSEELGLGAEFSSDFTVSNEVGSESTQSTSVTISDSVTITVPPGAHYRVYLEVHWDKRTEEFSIPVEIDPYGYTGAQFPSPVQGHYFWGMAHSNEFSPPFKSEIRGKVDCSYNSTGRIIVEDA